MRAIVSKKKTSERYAPESGVHGKEKTETKWMR